MSLKGTSNTPILSVPERLEYYLKEGMISQEQYENAIKSYNLNKDNKIISNEIKDIKKEKEGGKTPKPSRKRLYIILCIILLLSLMIAAVIYHNNAIEDAFNEGKYKGETTGYSRGYRIGYSKGYKAYEEISDEYRFFHKYAVIVTSSGKKYHKYNCYHIKNRTFYIYNIGNAKAKGYTPCLDCY